jgi:hypothetical protein
MCQPALVPRRPWRLHALVRQLASHRVPGRSTRPAYGALAPMRCFPRRGCWGAAAAPLPRTSHLRVTIAPSAVPTHPDTVELPGAPYAPLRGTPGRLKEPTNALQFCPSSASLPNELQISCRPSAQRPYQCTLR